MNTNLKKQNGFSLVELLVVVIIIGIIAAIAIPSLLASRRAANEASAISSLRAVHSAQITYLATVGVNTNYGNFDALSGAGLLDPTFVGANFVKSGYTLAASIPSAAPFSVYCATAAPTTGNGTRYFAVSETGVIYQHSAAIGCAAGVLTVGTAVPIQ